jgi:uncharacterized protein
MSMRIRVGLETPMSDGINLSTDLYLPPEGDRFPVLLCRTIYDNQMPQYVDWATEFVEAGYAVAIQDCRGRYDSDGEWEPYIHEQADGRETHDWIGRQPWCDGNIGTFGISYVGLTQVLPAADGSAYLKAVMPIASQEDNFGHLWIDGVFQLQIGIYFFQMGRHTMQDTSAARMTLDHVYSRLPICSALDDIGPSGPLKEFLSHPTFDSYWKSYSMKGRYDQISVPAHFVTGWYDNLLHEQLKLFTAWRKDAKTESARRFTKILIGPWSHYDIGELPAPLAIPQRHIRWYDQWLRGVDTGINDEPPIRLWVMGDDVWRDENEWPLARAQFTTYYLGSGGTANSVQGDGALGVTPSSDAPFDRYSYDPVDPVPTAGGQSLFLDTTGPQERGAIEGRADVLVYTGDALDRDLEVTGPVEVILYAATTAVDTDFTAALVDVHPDGAALIVCEGIVRARYRDSVEEPTLVEPGKVYAYRIDLWETSQVFKAGHRIRLEISSSNFPRFDRNLNTGGRIGMDDRTEVATQTVFHDAERPSHIRLPVIPR